MKESIIQHAIRLYLGQQPGVVIWRNQTGQAEYYNKDGKPRYVPFGLCEGSADLIGILAPTGRILAFEIKTAKGRAAEKQQLFLELVRKRGGFACIARSVEEAAAALNRARLGESQ